MANNVVIIIIKDRASDFEQMVKRELWDAEKGLCE